MNGIGYQFSPGARQDQRGNGAPPISPQEAVRILSFQLPKSQLGAGAVAPRGLLEAQGAQGAPNGILAQILAALSGGQPVKQGPFAQPAVGPFERQTTSFTAPSSPAPSPYATPVTPNLPRFTVEQPKFANQTPVATPVTPTNPRPSPSPIPAPTYGYSGPVGDNEYDY